MLVILSMSHHCRPDLSSVWFSDNLKFNDKHRPQDMSSHHSTLSMLSDTNTPKCDHRGVRLGPTPRERVFSQGTLSVPQAKRAIPSERGHEKWRGEV